MQSANIDYEAARMALTQLEDDMAEQRVRTRKRIRFVALMVAGGFTGMLLASAAEAWLSKRDELEAMGRYSFEATTGVILLIAFLIVIEVVRIARRAR